MTQGERTIFRIQHFLNRKNKFLQEYRVHRKSTKMESIWFLTVSLKPQAQKKPFLCYHAHKNLFVE